MIIPRLSFHRLCRQIIQEVNTEYNLTFGDDRVDMVTAQVEATDALQEATEAYMHEYFTGRYSMGMECFME